MEGKGRQKKELPLLISKGTCDFCVMGGADRPGKGVSVCIFLTFVLWRYVQVCMTPEVGNRRSELSTIFRETKIRLSNDPANILIQLRCVSFISPSSLYLSFQLPLFTTKCKTRRRHFHACICTNNLIW